MQSYEHSFSGRCFVFCLECSGFRVIECIKNKPNTLAAFQRFVAHIKRETGNTVKIVRSDQSIEYMNVVFTKYLQEQAIRQKLIAPYTPEQNGAAERDNRTIMEAVQGMLLASNIEIQFWIEAVHIIVYTLNRIATHTMEGRTPFELWYREKPSIAHMRIFGTTTSVYVPKPLRKKLGPKSQKGIFMEYYITSKAYRV